MGGTTDATEELAQLNRYRQGAVIAAVALLVLSLVSPNAAFAVLRAIAWAAAGVLSLLHSRKAQSLGLPASYLNAVIYFLVALVPLFRGR